MKKIIISEIKLIILSLFALLAFSTISSASSFDAKVSTTNVKVGDNFTVTVYANNAAGMYSVSTSNSNVSVISGSKSEFLENGSTTITFKAMSAGSTTITAKATDMTDLDDDTKAVTGSKTFNINITQNSGSTGSTGTSGGTSGNNSSGGNGSSSGGSKNNNGNTGGTTTKKGTLSSCYINGVKCNQYVTVTNKDSVPVKITTSTGEGATIYNSLTKKSYTVKSGVAKDIQIAEGTNTLTITLNSGAKETRKIYSQKEEEVQPNQIEEPEEEQQQEKVKPLLKALTIKDFTLTPEFSSEVYEYSVTLSRRASRFRKIRY